MLEDFVFVWYNNGCKKGLLLSLMLSLPLYIINGILGLTLGSYLNSWIWSRSRRDGTRDPRFGASQIGKRYFRRSQCVHCGQELTWQENIPLVSFIFLLGRCRTCHKKIPLDYFFVELAMSLGFLGLVYYHLHAPALIPIQLFRDLFFFALLIVVFVYDLKYYLILSGVVWGGAVIAFAVNYFFLGFSLYSLVLGMAVGGGFFMLQYIISRGRWIGGGDVRLGVMMGALLAWPNILAALFISYILGALVAVPLLLLKKKGLSSQIPFGTFLSVGTLVAMLWGSQIVLWYRALVGL